MSGFFPSLHTRIQKPNKQEPIKLPPSETRLLKIPRDSDYSIHDHNFRCFYIRSCRWNRLRYRNVMSNLIVHTTDRGFNNSPNLFFFLAQMTDFFVIFLTFMTFFHSRYTRVIACAMFRSFFSCLLSTVIRQKRASIVDFPIFISPVATL